MGHVADGLNSLQGREAGKNCLIVGGGPSSRKITASPPFIAEDFHRQHWDFIIAINGAFQLFNSIPPHYWLMLDYDNPRPDWFDAGYRQSCTKILSHTVREEYPDAIHAKVSTDEPELRSARLGLKMCPAETGTRLVGTSAICALHLAGILGASKVSMIGCELSFAGEQGEICHPYPCRDYGKHPTTAGEEMETHWYAEFQRFSCPWFVASAYRVKEYMQFAEARGMVCRDYSDGLLSLI
jgi:hypothetical protein